MIGVVYKLCCDGVEEFYVGSSKDFIERKRSHKYNCNNPNSQQYNLKLYQYIRENGGFDNWKFETLEEKEFETKKDRRIREQYYINLLRPTLNIKDAIQNEEKLKQYIKTKGEKRRIQIICACGGKTNRGHKKQHEKTEKHIKYITINITNLTNLTL